MDNKLIKLVFEMKDAPKELKDLAQEHYENVLELEEAKNQMKSWMKKNQAAVENIEISGKKLEQGLNHWSKKAVKQ